MKFIFRSAAVQAAVGWLAAVYLGFAHRTIRWRIHNIEQAEQVWDAGGAVIVCFWHSRISMSPACWPLERAQEPRALISRSADGEMIAHAMRRLGFPAIRGSKAEDARKAGRKGGSAAFREILKWLRAGNCVAITPDGPQGPVGQMTDGPLMLARAGRAAVLFIGLACRPHIRLNSWDRHIVPIPFGRGVMVWERQPDLGPEDDLEAKRIEWIARLNAVTDAAEAELA